MKKSFLPVEDHRQADVSNLSVHCFDSLFAPAAASFAEALERIGTTASVSTTPSFFTTELLSPRRDHPASENLRPAR